MGVLFALSAVLAVVLILILVLVLILIAVLILVLVVHYFFLRFIIADLPRIYYARNFRIYPWL